ncbi:MAG TPA: hypothetical protein VFR86_19090 [Burkholderiaceae bacterium]|nr:hypothetical protein [Burkholderiaceae bacterium]
MGALAACGSGGGGGGSPAPSAPVPAACAATNEAFTTAADSNVAVGKAAGAVVAGCTGALADIVWTQTAGPALTLLSAKTQAISFEPGAAGTYSFQASFRDAADNLRNATVSVNAVAPAGSSSVTVRADQAVRMGGAVSLRAWPQLASGDAVAELRWEQVDGPGVTLNTSADLRVVAFVAPAVTRDTLLRFRVTLTTTLGTTDSDDVLVLVEHHAQSPGTAQYVFAGHVSRAYAYRPGGPYAAVLVRCVADAQLQWSGSGKNLCPLVTLPFLAQDTAGNLPTVEQVMNRVVVSHDWMGEVFEQFLTTQDQNGDFRRLLNGVTAIVIGAHVRPSFYYAATGAIYLDAENFWLTAAQRDVIDELPDFRSGFDDELSYSSAWRYTRTTAGMTSNIFLPFPRTSRLPRDIGYLGDEAGWLLYHELAHASDFMPPAHRAGLNAGLSALDNISLVAQNQGLPSDHLEAQWPLVSPEMRGLAQVKFAGTAATATQKSYTPQNVGDFFSPDRATDEYGFINRREDLAMLFEEFMQAHRHDLRRDTAFTDKVVAGTTGDTLMVRWGTRGRVGETAVKPRAKLVVQHLAPWIDPATVDALPAPLAMRAGESWNANLLLPAPPRATALSARALGFSTADDRWLLERALRRPGGVVPPVEH